MEEHTEESKGIHALCEFFFAIKLDKIDEGLLIPCLLPSLRRRYPRKLEVVATLIGYLLLVEQFWQDDG